MAIRSTHPLKQSELTYLQNWKQWLEIWNANPCLEVRHSVLHFGLETPLGQLYGEETGWRPVDETYSERILFYLSAADGWNEGPEGFALEPPDGRFHSNRPRFNTSLGLLKGDGALGQRLAQKAFAALFNALVPSPGKRGEEEEQRGLNRYNSRGELVWSYAYYMTQKDVVAFLRFFRPIGGSSFRGIHLRNLPQGDFFGPLGEVNKRLIERVRSFLADYLVFLWKKEEPIQPGWSYTEGRNAEEEGRRQEALKRFGEEMKLYNLLKRHRFLMAVMLLCLGEGERLYPLVKDERTLKLVHQFAMGAKVDSNIYNKERGYLEAKGEGRRPQSLEEAHRYGDSLRSEAAKYLLLRGIIKKAESEREEWERPHRERAQAERAERAREAREKEAEALRKKADELFQGS